MSFTFEDFSLLHPLTEDFPYSDLVIKELEDNVREVLNSLPEQCREIYELNRFDNLSYSEIAEKPGV